MNTELSSKTSTPVSNSPNAASAVTDADALPSFEVNGCRIDLLGTAHVSRQSADEVESLLASGLYDGVAVELCPNRERSLRDPDTLSKMNLFEVLKSGKAPLVMASLALGAYQQRIAAELGIEPGAEMRAALRLADKHQLPVEIIDRDIGVTLKRVYRNVPWWQRLTLVSGLFASLVSHEKVSEDEIEKLKQGDALTNTFAQFADQAGEIYKPLISERDRYMVARLRQAAAGGRYRRLLAVVGAGHVSGMEQQFASPRDRDDPARALAELSQVPPPSRWPKLIPWLIVALILVGFAIGFSRSSDLGWELVADWVLINGGLAALGAAIALAHPLTVIGAFLAAPLTSLNPTVGAGMVTGAIELWLRKPEVGDFSHLRTDTTSVRGWWRNRVTRVFLVFLLSTLGSAAGTYIAGFRIFEKLS